MTNDTKTISDLLRDLATGFIDKPAELQIASQESRDGAVYFAMKGALDDEPKLIGRAGAHVDALRFIVFKLGRARTRDFSLRLITEGSPRDRRPVEFRDVIEHDPRPARELLFRVIEALEFKTFSVGVSPGDGARTALTFVFDIKVFDGAAVREIVAPDPAAPAGLESLTLLTALGTIFRAVAKKSGVRYQVDVSSL